MFKTNKMLKSEIDELQLQKEMLQGLLQDERASSRMLRKNIRVMEVAHKELLDKYRKMKKSKVPEILKREVSE